MQVPAVVVLLGIWKVYRCGLLSDLMGHADERKNGMKAVGAAGDDFSTFLALESPLGLYVRSGSNVTDRRTQKVLPRLCCAASVQYVQLRITKSVRCEAEQRKGKVGDSVSCSKSQSQSAERSNNAAKVGDIV